MATTFMALDERSQDYLLAHQPPEHDTLRRLREATAPLPEARMQISPEQGHLLALLIRLLDARQWHEQSTRIIEQENARFCIKIGVAPESAAFSTCVEGLGDLRRSHEQRIQAEMQGLL